MRRYRLKRQVAFLWILLAPPVESSVIFPVKQTTLGQSKRKHKHRQNQSNCPWTGGIASLRNANPSMVSNNSRMPLAFSAQHGGLLLVAASLGYIGKMLKSEAVNRAFYFWVHAGPIVFHYKFTRWYLCKTHAPLEKRDKVYNVLHEKYCNRTMGIVLHLKGLFVKIAQIISSRPDFVPPQYVNLFASAQDSIPQWPIEEVIEIVDKTLDSEFGLGFDEVFESMDPQALGSASIGQVHRAVLKAPYSQEYGGGNVVAVKVMHPGAEERFHNDFQVFRWLCKVALKGWEPLLNECYRQIMTEFDYKREAESLSTVRRHMTNSPYNNRIKIPEPLSTRSTKELLIMEMLNGKKLSASLEEELVSALGGDPAVASDLIKRKRLELILGKDKMETLGHKTTSRFHDSVSLKSKLRLFSLYKKTQKYIDLLVDVQGHQMLFNGIFNGDPHPGNILALKDGSLGLIDYGQTKSISNDERLGIARVVDALGNGYSKGEVADAMRKLGFKTKFDKDEILAKYATLFFDSDIEGKLIGCATPQLYFATLTQSDPLVNVPDVAIFVARASFILRGMGTLLERQIQTSSRWSSQAKQALLAAEQNSVHNASLS